MFLVLDKESTSICSSRAEVPCFLFSLQASKSANYFESEECLHLPVDPQTLIGYGIDLITKKKTHYWTFVLRMKCEGTCRIKSYSPWKSDPEISCSTKPCLGLLTCRCPYNGLYNLASHTRVHTLRIWFCSSALGPYAGRHLIPADLEIPHAVMSRSLAAGKCQVSMSLSQKTLGLFHAVCPGCLRSKQTCCSPV